VTDRVPGTAFAVRPAAQMLDFDGRAVEEIRYRIDLAGLHRAPAERARDHGPIRHPDP
jgi:hypothetical protein